MHAASSAVTGDLLLALRDLLGERVTSAPAVRDHHSHGESYHAPAPPDLVAYPRTTEEISAIVRAAAERDVPIVAFGAGTSLEGQVLALRGGISVDLTQMNQVLRVSVDDLDATVQAGVTHRQLNKHLVNTGLTFFVDPGADATIGGMTATGASGTTAVRYGTMRENVRGLTVVLADGRVITTGGRARKSSAGYDLTRLFVGSEGTLGIISDVTVRLQPLPEAVAAAVCSFPSIDAAVKTVIATIQLGVPVARIELLDEVQMDAIISFLEARVSGAADAFLRVSRPHRARGRRPGRDRAVACCRKRRFGIRVGHASRGPCPLWRARHDSYYASLALRPGAKGWTTDACVPISRLADCIVESKRDLDESSLTGTLVGACGGRQFPHALLSGPGPARRDDRSPPFERTPGPPRDRHGRHLLGRARRGGRQDALPGPRARRSARRHASHQTGARPQELMNPEDLDTSHGFKSHKVQRFKVQVLKLPVL